MESSHSDGRMGIQGESLVSTLAGESRGILAQTRDTTNASQTSYLPPLPKHVTRGSSDASKADSILNKVFEKQFPVKRSGIDGALETLDKLGLEHPAALPSKVAAKRRVEAKRVGYCREYQVGTCTRSNCKFKHELEEKTPDRNAKTVYPEGGDRESKPDPKKEKLRKLTQERKMEKARLFNQKPSVRPLTLKELILITFTISLAWVSTCHFILVDEPHDYYIYLFWMVVSVTIAMYQVINNFWRLVTYCWYTGDINEYQQSVNSYGYIFLRKLKIPFAYDGYSPMSEHGYQSYQEIWYDRNMVEALYLKEGTLEPSNYLHLRIMASLDALYSDERTQTEKEYAEAMYRQELIFHKTFAKDTHSSKFVNIERL